MLTSNAQPALELRKEIVAKADADTVNNLSIKKNQLLQHRTSSSTVDTSGSGLPTVSLSTIVLYHN